MNHKIILLLPCFLLSACSTWQSEPVTEQQFLSLKQLCIVHNPKNSVEQFEHQLVNRLESYGIQTRIVNAVQAQHCPYQLQYSAEEQYNWGLKLKSAELKLYLGQQRIGFAQYHPYSQYDYRALQSNQNNINQLVDRLMQGRYIAN